MTMSIEHSNDTGELSTQPETVARLLRQLGLRNASALQEADALRAWIHDHVPNQALRVSIRRNGYGFLLDRSVGRLARRSAQLTDRRAG